MGRKKRHRSSKKSDSYIDDVINGRVRPSVRPLIEAIHAVNPTGREEPPDRKARQYQTKSRLQSILVNHFGEELDIRLDPQDENVVLILHRMSGVDACHTVIDELDIDARSTVRRVLDTQRDEETPVFVEKPPARSQPEAEAVEKGGDMLENFDVDRLRRRGIRALETFDYDDARICFEKAWAQRPDDVETTTLLLDFLINHMGAYERGLEIATDAGAPTTNEIRVLAALAAVRLDRHEEACRMAENINDPALGEVWLKSADTAIDMRDWGTAEAFVEKAETLNPQDARVLPRRTSIETGRAEERSPHEAAAEALLRDERFDEAAAAAQALKTRWPDSRVARRILAAIKERNRARELDNTLNNAIEAEQTGELERALSLYKKAIDLGGVLDAIRPKMETLDVALKEQADRKTVARFSARFYEEELETVVLAYLELNTGLRQKVRQELDTEILFLTDQLISNEVSKRHRQQVARAIAALSTAERRFTAGDIETASQMILPYEETLHSLEQYQVIRDAHTTLLHRQQKQHAHDALQAFEQAVLEDRHSDVESLRSRVIVKDLNDDQRQRYANLEERLARKREIESINVELDAAKQRRDLFTMKYLLSRLESTASPCDTGAIREERRRINAEIRERWRVWILDGEDALATRVSRFFRYDFSESRQYWLSADGKTVGFGHPCGYWFFGQISEVETGALRRVFAARSDVPMDKYTETMFDGRILTFCDAQGIALRFDTVTGDVVDRFDYRSLLEQDDNGEFGLLIPGRDLLFAHLSRTKTAKLSMKAISMRPMKIEKEFGSQGWNCFLLPLDELHIATLKEYKTCCLFNDKGFLEARLGLPDKELHDVAAHPDGKRLVFAVRCRSDDLTDDEGTLYIVSVDLSGNLGASYRIDGSHYESQYQIATSTSHGGLIFMLWLDDENKRRLTALSERENGFERRYDIIVPHTTSFVRDIWARRTAILAVSSAGHTIELLGPEPPNIDDWIDDRVKIPSMDFQFLSCDWPDAKTRKAAESVLEWMRQLRLKESQKKINEYIERNIGDTDAILAMGHAKCLATRTAYIKTLEPFVDSLSNESHMKSELNLLRAHYYIRERDWEEIVPYLDACDPLQLSMKNRAHYYHVSGIVAYHANDLRRARACFFKMLEFEETCTDCAPLIAMTGGHVAHSESEASPEYQTALALIEVIKNADEAIDAGNLAEGLRLLNIELVWQLKEQQSMARLCYLLMTLSDPTVARGFDKLELIAAFVDEESRPNFFLNAVLRLGESHWSDERIESIVSDASAWLERWRPPNHQKEPSTV